MRFQAATALASLAAAININEAKGSFPITFDPKYDFSFMQPGYQAMTSVWKAANKLDSDKDGSISKKEFVDKRKGKLHLKEYINTEDGMDADETMEWNFKENIDLNEDGKTAPKEILESEIEAMSE